MLYPIGFKIATLLLSFSQFSGPALGSTIKSSNQSPILGENTVQKSRVSQCNRLIDVVNQGHTISQDIIGTDAEAMEKLAIDLLDLSQRIDEVGLTDPNLQSYRNRFVRIYGSLSIAAHQVGMALRELDQIPPTPTGVTQAQRLQERVEQASQRGDRAAAQEEILVREINNYCSASTSS